MKPRFTADGLAQIHETAMRYDTFPENELTSLDSNLDVGRMATKDPRIDAYIAKSADFAKPILNHLRKLVHTACPEVEETMKWSFPHFDYKGVLCSMASFKQHCAFGFWKAALIFGDSAPGKNPDDAMGHFGRITARADLPDDKVLIGYIKEAVRLNDEGIKLPAKPKSKEKRELAVPADFTTALKKNRTARTTFENFSYSHKKEYVQWITEAKREETRKQRMDTAIQWLTEGKSRNWKYARC
jgi:uncharacterized protein YdeI (YjbR/CyaY-like superfamily)